MLLTYPDLVELVNAGMLRNAVPENVNAASIDVTLGDSILRESQWGRAVNLASKDFPEMIEVGLGYEDYNLQPGEFVLAQTREVFHLPNNIAAEYKLKSSLARAGLDHALAGWCDPGWHGSVLTVELKNNTRHHSLVLRAGMKIGQVVFWAGKPVPEEASYATRGRYNNDRKVTASKGLE